MIDTIAAFIFGAMFATDLAVLIGLAQIQASSKVKAIAAAAIWTVAVLWIAALGGFAPGSIGRFPAPVLAFSFLVIAGFAAWTVSAGFRHALLSVPNSALVGVNTFRIAGVFFILLYEQGRLSAPFGPVAGWGDIVTGVAAIPIAAYAAFGKPVSTRMLAIWNVFGALDLVVAVTLAFLSAPGSPFQIFTDNRGTEVLTHIPWIAAATLLVPLYIFTHWTIFARMKLADSHELPRSVAAAAV
jgi:hypothetical protein